MKKGFVCFFVVVFCLFFFSCSFNDSVALNDSDVSIANCVTLEVSAAQTKSDGARAVYSVPEYDISDEMLKDEVKGDAVASVTPSAFILDIDGIKLFNPKNYGDVTDGAEESLELVSVMTYEAAQGKGNIIPKRYNMLSSKGLSSVSLPLSKLRQNWHGLSLMIRPGGSEETNGMWAGSILGVRKDSLPDGITAGKIVNYLYVLPFGIRYSDEYVWFSFYDIIPFKLGGMLGYITFYDGADAVTLINSEGENGDWCYGAESSYGNQSGAVFPMETINLSELENPEITISVDTENLIEFYETADGRYFASLSKSNPFPFRVIADEYDPKVFLYTEQAVDDIKQAVPFDCFDYVMNSKRGICHILVHTEPNYSGISYAEVYRSTRDVFDDEAELIYSGEELSIVDYNAPSGSDAYYFIRNVDSSGNKSEIKAFTRIDGTGSDA